MTSSKRSSIDSTVNAGLTNTAQLEQLTMATYSLFTANSGNSSNKSGNKKHSKTRSKGSSARSQSAGHSRCTSGKSTQVQTPHSGFVNGALEDDNEDLTDISLS